MADYFVGVPIEAPALNMGCLLVSLPVLLEQLLTTNIIITVNHQMRFHSLMVKRFVPFVVILCSTIVALILVVFLAGCSNWNQQFWYLIVNSQRDSSNSRTILVWYFRTSSFTIWTSPYVDNSNQLYSIRWDI